MGVGSRSHLLETGPRKRMAEPASDRPSPRPLADAPAESRALVMGSGGFGGIAWEVGVLQGLRDAGVDILNWDLVVGTSAGAFVGARLLGEGSLDGLVAAQTSMSRRDDELLARATGRGLVRAIRLARWPGLSWIRRLWFAWMRLSALVRYLARHGLAEIRHLGPVLRVREPGAEVSPGVLARVGAIALSAQTQGEGAWLDYWQAALPPVVDWPTTRLLITALDVQDGARAAFEAGSGAGLGQAVAASTAVPTLVAPIRIGDRRYVDGGGKSQTNADLARGQQMVIVIAPVDRGHLTGEVAMLEAAGATVSVIRPGEAAMLALGTDLALLDLDRRSRAARAGLSDGFEAGTRLDQHG
jgi:NTE family protein